MTIRTSDGLLAIGAGGLLAVMIHLNSTLATLSSPLFASWIAHGIGSMAALLLVFLYFILFRAKQEQVVSAQRNTPWWCYLGGIPGALTVALAAVTVNSPLGLAGTLAFALLGQILFGSLCDHFGLFGVPKKRFTVIDACVVILVMTGSYLMIFFGG